MAGESGRQTGATPALQLPHARCVSAPPGKHTVDFSFSLPHKPLYVTLSAFLVGLGLGGFLWYSSRRAGRLP